MIQDYTVDDILRPLWDTCATYWPCTASAIINDILWKYAGSEMGTRRPKLDRFQHAEIFKVAIRKLDAFPMEAWDLNESTLEGNRDILDSIRKDLGLSDRWVEGGGLCPISGDQLTIVR